MSVGGSRYRLLLGVPGVARLVAAALVARLPVGIISLALVLFVHAQAGGFALAGAAAAAYGVCQGAVSPLLGRLVDRVGQARMLRVAGPLNAAALVGVVVAGLAGAPVVVEVVLAGVSGAARPPVSAFVRRLLSAMLGPGEQLDGAYALESVLAEAVSVAGPLLTAGLAAAGSPAAALLCAAGCSLVGTLWYAGSPHARSWRPEPTRGRPARALHCRGVRTLVAAGLSTGVGLGALAVALPAFAAQHGSAAAGGLALAAMSLASLSAGLWYGTRHFRGSVTNRYLWLAALSGVTLIPPVFAPSIASLIVLMALAGLFMAPAYTCAFSLIDRLAPAAALSEAFTG